MRPPAGRHARVDPAVRRGRDGASAASLAVGAAVVVAALAWTWPAEPPSAPPLASAPTGHPATAGPPPPTPPPSTPRPTEASPTDTTTAAPTTDRWRRILASLDHRRAEAFAADEPELLRAVYVAGSQVMRQDRATLAAYRARGLRLTDLRMRVLRLRMVEVRGSRVVLEVVDQLAAATAVDRSGKATPLRADQPSAHRIVISRTPAGWRIASVRPANQGEPVTRRR